MSVSVNSGVDVRRVRIEAGAHDPADFAMWINAFAEKFHASAQNEIAFHPLPHEMKLILSRPHIRARSGDGIALLLGVVKNRSRLGGIPHVFVTIELPNGLLLNIGKRAQRQRR